MATSRKPGIDRRLVTRFGETRDGQPLSFNRLPSAEVAPWIGWLYATSVAAPADYELNCHLLNDSAMIRIQLEGDWTAQTRDGTLRHGPRALYFGPQTRAMPISVRGSFTSVGLALKPGAGFAVTGRPAIDFTDRVVELDTIGIPGQAAMDALTQVSGAEDLVRVLESLVRVFIGAAGPPAPHAVSSAFEMLSLTDPAASVALFAQQQGISLRQLERLTARDFGLSPKQVMRRARALDMASHLRGVADDGEAEELMLRYYDQSHLIRDFTQLFGMSPRQFRQTPQPLMTLALESRQSRRLALLERLPPGEPMPWVQG